MKGKRTTGGKEHVTMKTIAEEAGVTLTTVSRILNHKGGKYAEKTRNQIFSIANRYKYRPNALVHGMQTGKTGTAGVMVPADSPFYSQVVTGIHKVFVNHETIMLLSWNNRTLNQREETLERQIIHQMVDRRVEGIILRPSSEDFVNSYFEEIWDRNIPLILIDRELKNSKTDFVGSDNPLVGTLAAEHLISLGHRRILFMGSEKASTSRHREAGFRKVLNQSPHASGHTVPLHDWDHLHQQLTGTSPPTAMFCYNDDIARDVATFLRENGFSIPEDLSLVGCGNLPTPHPTLALTTFDQHPVDMGTTAAHLYLDRLSNPGPDRFTHNLITPSLLIRGTTRTIG